LVLCSLAAMGYGEKVNVGSLPFDITDGELRTVFETYGQVTDVQLLSPGTATVTYSNADSADDAVSVLHDIYKIRLDAESPITVRIDGDDKQENSRTVLRDRSRSRSPARDSRDNTEHRAQGDANAPEERHMGEGHKVFAGGLPDNISEQELRTVFATYGAVNHIHIMKPMEATGLRAAFIFYEDKAAGDDAIKVLDKIYKIRADASAAISVKWAIDKESPGDRKIDKSETGHKLFVGSLPEDISEDEVTRVFSTYGQVNLVHLMSPNNVSGNKAALVFYEKKESGEDAIQMLHDKYKIREDAAEPIRVQWGRDKQDIKGKGKGDDNGKGGKGKGKDDGKSWQGDSWGSSSGGDRWGSSGGDSWSGGGDRWSDNSRGGGGDRWADNSWQDRDRGSSWGGRDDSWRGDDRRDSRGGWSDDKGKGGKSDNKGKSSSKGGGMEMCGDHIRGVCTRGDNCKYSHDSAGGKGDKGDKGGGKGDKGGDRGYDRGKGDKGGDRGYDRGSDKGGDRGYDRDSGKGGKDKHRDEPSAQPSGRLYVANLPEDISDHALEYVFNNYGKVKNVHVITGKVVKGCVSAFVEYETTDDAETAVASLNDVYEIRPGFGPILVKFANAKGAGKGDKGDRDRPYY